MDNLYQNADLQYLANISWYKKLYTSTYVLFNKYENHKKRNFNNRCMIAGANGPILLSVPLIKGRDQKTRIKDLRISNSENWQKRHWRSITSSYNSSPWFYYFKDEMADIFSRQYEFLIDWNYACLEWTLNKLKIDIKYDWLKDIEPTKKDLPGLTKSGDVKMPPEQIKYRQVFEDKIGFIPDLSIIDLMFCTGPKATIEILST